MPLQLLELEQTSITGMRDNVDPTTARPGKAFLLENVYPEDPEISAAVVGRPGFTKAGAQLGSGGNRQGQGVFQYTQLDGTERTIVFVGGKMYTYDWGADSFSEVTLTGVSIGTTEKLFFQTFADKLIVNPNDGSNKPWEWDDTTFTSLTNAPLAFGRIAVYYAKLFFINNADRAEFQWSEEASSNTGYTAGGLNNAWKLQQTDQEPLFALYGTNVALYYFRARSIGAVFGQVTTNFEAQGTREGVSQTIGTTSPGSVLSHDNEIYFLDADGKPRTIRPPGFVNDEMWQDLRTQIALIDVSKLANVEAVNYTPANLIRIGMAETGSTPMNVQQVIDSRTKQIAGVFKGYTFTAHGMVKNGSGVATLMHLSDDGFAYFHGAPDGTVWDDGLNAGSASISHTVTGTPVGYDTRDVKAWDRIDLTLRARTANTSLAINYITPHGTSTAQTVTTSLKSEGDPSVETHATVGIDGSGRWIMPKVVHDQAAEEFGLISMQVSGYPDTDYPEAK